VRGLWRFLTLARLQGRRGLGQPSSEVVEMKPYTPAVHGVKGLPGPTGWGIYREAAFPLKLSLAWITPVPNRSCLSSRVRRTLKPAHMVLVARCMVSC
jgi:hypothetical protein